MLTTANQEMADIDTVAGGTERSATTLELILALSIVVRAGMLPSREERTAEQATGSESAS